MALCEPNFHYLNKSKTLAKMLNLDFNNHKNDESKNEAVCITISYITDMYQQYVKSLCP